MIALWLLTGILGDASGEATAPPATSSGKPLVIPYRKRADEPKPVTVAATPANDAGETATDAAMAAIADRAGAALAALPGFEAQDALAVDMAAQMALEAAQMALEQARLEDEEAVLMLLLAA